MEHTIDDRVFFVSLLKGDAAHFRGLDLAASCLV